MYSDNIKQIQHIELIQDFNKIHAVKTVWSNTNKYYHIRFTRHARPLVVTYFIDRVLLSEFPSIWILGVFMNATYSKLFVVILTQSLIRLTDFMLRQMNIFKEPTYIINNIYFNLQLLSAWYITILLWCIYLFIYL